VEVMDPVLARSAARDPQLSAITVDLSDIAGAQAAAADRLTAADIRDPTSPNRTSPPAARSLRFSLFDGRVGYAAMPSLRR
jgi:hypothetical protein